MTNSRTRKRNARSRTKNSAISMTKSSTSIRTKSRTKSRTNSNTNSSQGIAALALLQCRPMGRVANASGMDGRLSEFNSISRLQPDVSREMIISRDARSLVSYNGSIFKY